MTIQQLLEEALNKNNRFKKIYNYRHTQLKRKLSLDWLMPRLEEILGKSYVKEAAEAQIEANNTSSEQS